jgi:hypothetical protein
MTHYTTQDIPHGYCGCGCGQKTTIASRNDTKGGKIKGQPLRFISGHNMRAKTKSEMFWRHVVAGHPDECWEWKGARSSAPWDYGQVMCDGKQWSAHRLSYTLYRGQIPEGIKVCHSCDNPPCCNPNHLFLGTQADNMEDMEKKGRPSKGIGRHNAKFTEDGVRTIRRLVAEGVTQGSLARRYGVTKGAISHIVNRLNWKHVE